MGPQGELQGRSESTDPKGEAQGCAESNPATATMISLNQSYGQHHFTRALLFAALLDAGIVAESFSNSQNCRPVLPANRVNRMQQPQQFRRAIVCCETHCDLSQRARI